MRQEHTQVFGLQNAACVHLWRSEVAVHTAAGAVLFCVAAAGWWLDKVTWHTSRWNWLALSFFHPFVGHRPGRGCALLGVTHSRHSSCKLSWSSNLSKVEVADVSWSKSCCTITSQDCQTTAAWNLSQGMGFSGRESIFGKGHESITGDDIYRM